MITIFKWEDMMQIMEQFLLNKGNDKFIAEKLNGVTIKGQVRSIKPIKLANNKQAFVYARNNDSTMVIDFKNSVVK